METWIGEGFNKKGIEKGWTLYTHEDGYQYFVKTFGEKLVMFDNFSVTPVVVSTEQLDESNFLETLELVYSTNELSDQLRGRLEDIISYASQEAYDEAKSIFDYYFGN